MSSYLFLAFIYGSANHGATIYGMLIDFQILVVVVGV